MVRAIELLNGQELPSLESGQPAKKLLVSLIYVPHLGDIANIL